MSNWPLEIDRMPPFAYIKNFITPQKCEEIINIGKKKGTQKGLVGFGAKSKYDKKIRKSSIVFLHHEDGLGPFFQELTSAVVSLNKQFYNFHISAFSEGLQFTHYKAPGQKYGKHFDRGPNGIIRKLSVSIQLSDPTKYKGGDLNLYEGEDPIKTLRDQGALNAFPSFFIHEVTPVTKGERFSLVAWVTGDPFR
jgi:PKHD-type hydroxylase|tara:strand:+ start:240 stop:821 length:582 start_codon:yes stop_codon:yes gene_type:complete